MSNNSSEYKKKPTVREKVLRGAVIIFSFLLLASLILSTLSGLAL